MRSKVFIKMACCIMCIIMSALMFNGCGKKFQEDSGDVTETASLAESEPEIVIGAGFNEVQSEDTIEETVPELMEETIAETEKPELQYAEEEILLDETCFFEWDGNNDGYDDILHYVEREERRGSAADCYELFIWQPEQEIYEKEELIPVDAIDYKNHELFRCLYDGLGFVTYTIYGLQDGWYEEERKFAFNYLYDKDENGEYLASAIYSINNEVIAQYDITGLTWEETVSFLGEKYPEFDYWWKMEEYPQLALAENIILWDGNDDGYEDILIYRGTGGGSGGSWDYYDWFVWSQEEEAYMRTPFPSGLKIDYEAHKLYDRGQDGLPNPYYRIYGLRDGEYQLEKELKFHFEYDYVEEEGRYIDIVIYTDWNGVEEETDITGLTWGEIKELMESKYPEFNFWREG